MRRKAEPAPTGAHLSIAGGLPRALERARDLGASALQIFTKQPQRWAERPLSEEEVEAWRASAPGSGVRAVASHDSYLINLASPDPALFARSRAAFRAELARCVRLGLGFLVTHPGNATDGDREAGLRRNAEAVGEALANHPGPTVVLLETTAGSGTALGWRFEELAALLEAIPAPERERLGICLDTAHVHAAGYDLAGDWEGVRASFDGALGLERLRLLHVNDAAVALGSRVDRHAHLGEGEIGEEGLRAVLADPRLAHVPRVLETPKEDDHEANDRKNLRVLRRLSRPAGRRALATGR